MGSEAEFGCLDGHTILLIELRPGQRTFKFYNTQFECLKNLIGMFEDTSKDHEMSDFLKWIDDFYELRMFVMDTNIKRYKVIKGEELKGQFEVDEEATGGSYRPAENGLAQTDCSPIDDSSQDLDDHRALDMEESADDVDNEDNYDD